MPPPIFTDAYIRKMCPENHPIPLAKIPTMGATKPPQYLAKGYTGIKYVPPPHRPPRTVHTLATMMAGTSEPDAVRTQEEVINRFVLENAVQTMGDILGVRQGVEYFVNEELFAGKFLRDEGEEETKGEVAEVEVGTMGPTTPEGKGGGGVATPDSTNKSTRGRGLGGGQSLGREFMENAARRSDAVTLVRSPGQKEADEAIEMMKRAMTTRSTTAAEEKKKDIKKRLRGAPTTTGRSKY